jgi:hypothetical protein
MHGIGRYQTKTPGGKAAPLMMIIILLFNVCGYFILYDVLQAKTHREIKARINAGINEKELTVIELNSLNAAEIHWIEADKEFTWHGNMYDVVKSDIKNGVKQIYCLNDTKERKLIKEFEDKNDQAQKTRKLLTNFSLVFLPQPSSNPFITESTDQDFFTRQSYIKSKIREIADPPPKFSIPA